jgi:hypothetical protein
MTAGVVTVMTATVAARETEERHCGHASGAEYHTENVEVHLSAHGCQRTLFSKELIQESPDENSYGDSVIRVSRTQLNS